jgi:nucleoside-diphosphate-sugar epimerase
MRVLIAGFGYVGTSLGAELARRGHEVFGLRRSVPPVSEDTAGVTCLQGDLTKPETLVALPNQYDWVINCAAPGGGSPNDYQRLYLMGNAHLITWLRTAPPRKFIYTSSTGVYRQNDGSVITEESPVAPSNVLVAAEQLLLRAHAEQNFPTIILRVAGITGPGRGHWLKQFLSGEATLEGDGHRFLNMIQRDDVVGAIIAALERGAPGTIYNAVDDEPVSQRDLFAWLADRLKHPMPPSASVTPETERKRGATNKRVSNAKLKHALGYQFIYPTFREAFNAELTRLGIAPG